MPDLSSAASYGKLDYIFNGGEKVFALPGPSRFKARKKLEGFNPEEDYILWPGVGDPIAYAIVIDILASMDVDFYSLLNWDRKRSPDGTRESGQGFYVPIRIIRKEKRNEQVHTA
jgi:hypothetical protein